MTRYNGCLDPDTDQKMCLERQHPEGHVYCMKARGHTGDRHAFDWGFMSGAWGYVAEVD